MMEKKMTDFTRMNQGGFTLVEVLLVVVILAMVSTIAIPKVSGSSDKARRNADITTAHQVQAALDRYQVENGLYPKSGELTAKNGKVEAQGSCKFIPDYIAKLDPSVTQQRERKIDGKSPSRGFGIESISAMKDNASDAEHFIMIYLSDDGYSAEVRAYGIEGDEVIQIWPVVNESTPVADESS